MQQGKDEAAEDTPHHRSDTGKVYQEDHAAVHDFPEIEQALRLGQHQRNRVRDQQFAELVSRWAQVVFSVFLIVVVPELADGFVIHQFEHFPAQDFAFFGFVSQ